MVYCSHSPLNPGNLNFGTFRPTFVFRSAEEASSFCSRLPDKFGTLGIAVEEDYKQFSEMDEEKHLVRHCESPEIFYICRVWFSIHDQMELLML